jgi:hypothetical protein
MPRVKKWGGNKEVKKMKKLRPFQKALDELVARHKRDVDELEREHQNAFDALIEKISGKYPQYPERSLEGEQLLDAGRMVLHETRELYLTIEQPIHDPCGNYNYDCRLWITEPDISGGHADIGRNDYPTGNFLGRMVIDPRIRGDLVRYCRDLDVLKHEIVGNLGCACIVRDEDKSGTTGMDWRCRLYDIQLCEEGEKAGQ